MAVKPVTGEPAAPLRIGVMLDRLTVANWEALILRQIAEAPFCEVSLFIINDEQRTKPSIGARLRANRALLAYKLYTRVDERLFGRADDAFAAVDLASEFAAVPRLHTIPLAPRRFEHRLDPDAIAAVRAARLDVILRFGFNIIRGDILDVARFGVWSFHHGDNHEYRGTPAFFWEMYEGNCVSGTILQRLTAELDGGGVLYRSWSATDPISLRRGRNRAFWKSAHFVIRRLRDLHERGWEYIEQLPVYSEQTSYVKGIYKAPTNRQVLRFVLRTARGVARRRLRDLITREQWFIAYRARRMDSSLADGVLDGFTEILPAADRFYADPFLLSHGRDDYVLFEEYKYASGKGIISCLPLGAGLEHASRRTVLDHKVHLSYPFTFTWENVAYMIPETSASRTIELYRAEQPPYTWTLDRILMAGIDASDTTLYDDGRILWLFTSVAMHGAAATDELFLFWATSLDGSWTPHPMNPVVSDVRHARPTGRVFRSGCAVIRPAQDCSVRYGSVIVLNRIDVLTPTEYRETVLRTVRLPGRRVLATHTYDVGERYEVVDGLRSRSKVQLISSARRYRR